MALNAPQAPGLPQLTVQVTAALPPRTPLGKIATADKVAVALTASDVGGDDANMTAVGPVGGGGGPLLPEPGPPQPAANKTIKEAKIRYSIGESSAHDQCPIR